MLGAMGGTTGWHYAITRNARYAPHLANYAGGRPGAPSRRRPGSTPSSCSSPTTPGSGSSPPGTPAPWSTRPRGGDPGAHAGASPGAAAPAVGPAPAPAGPGALHGGSQHLVRERARLAAGHPGGRRRPAHHRRALLPAPERLRRLRRRQRPPHPRDRGVRRPGQPLRAAAADVRRPVHAGRGRGRAGHGLLRRGADAPGDGARRLDVRRDRPLHHARGLGRPRGPRPRVPLRPGGRLVDPNPTGLEGVFEAFCPPHHADMAAAVEAFAQRKFGPGGPYHRDTAGAWSDSPGVRRQRPPVHLVRSFTQTFGIAPHQYLVARRIDAARKRLLGGEPIPRVAAGRLLRPGPLTRLVQRHVGTPRAATPSSAAASDRREQLAVDGRPSRRRPGRR